MHATPASLLERLRLPDDSEAWTRFVMLYAPILYSWASRLGMQESDAADFVQEIFAILLHKMPEFHYDPAFRFRAWLRTVTLNHWRDRAKRRPIPLPIGATGVFDEYQDADRLEVFIESEHNAYVVRRALDIMQSDFQPVTWQAFWQLTVDGAPAHQIGISLGLSVSAVYAAKYRVLARLRSELAGLYP